MNTSDVGKYAGELVIKQTGREASVKTIQGDRETNRFHRDSEAERADGNTNKQANRQKHTGKQTDGQTDRQPASQPQTQRVKQPAIQTVRQ